MTGMDIFSKNGARVIYEMTFQTDQQLKALCTIVSLNFKEYSPAAFSKSDLLVDFGGGSGTSCAWVAKLLGIHQSIVVDGSQEMLDGVELRFKEYFGANYNVKTLRADLECDRITIESGKATMAMSTSTFKFLEDFEHVVRQASRVLQPSRLFVGDIYLHREDTMRSFPYDIDGGVDMYTHSLRRFEHLARSNGFVIEKNHCIINMEEPCDVQTYNYDFVLRKK